MKGRKRPKNPIGRPTKYSEEMPQALLDFFQAIKEEVLEVEENMALSGVLQWVQKPVDPPLLSGFAISMAVHRDTLHEWARVHTDFSDAMKTAKEIQEWVVARMVSHGAYAPAFGIFMLKNCSDWTDKHEVGLDTPLTLVFDKQDERA